MTDMSKFGGNFLNFRSLAGLPIEGGGVIAEGRLFRSAAFDALHPDESQKLQAAGIRQVADLRSAEEQRAHPSPLPAAGIDAVVTAAPGGVADALRSITSDRATAETMRSAMLEVYRTAPSSFALPFAQMISSILDGRGGLLIHCAIGKDRTGMATALLLEAVGVSRDAILADYLVTNQAQQQILAALAGRFPARRQPPAEIIAPLLAADPSYLGAFWESLDQDHGGVSTYLRAGLGLPASAQGALRAALSA